MLRHSGFCVELGFRAYKAYSVQLQGHYEHAVSGGLSKVLVIPPATLNDLLRLDTLRLAAFRKKNPTGELVPRTPINDLRSRTPYNLQGCRVQGSRTFQGWHIAQSPGSALTPNCVS